LSFLFSLQNFRGYFWGIYYLLYAQLYGGGGVGVGWYHDCSRVCVRVVS
jgi:hypothetical protein